ncbi:MAG: hypothetical protein KF823_00270 [Xanthomonadales bacterium]|nr:hypothetical protein [Xanthomonadales bacterium]
MPSAPDAPNPILRALAIVVAVIVSAGLAMYLGGTRSDFEPARRNGPLLLVHAPDGGHALWLALHQTEVRSRRIGGGRHSSGRWITERLYHLRLQVHAPDTTRPTLSRTLAVVHEKDSGHQAVLRILGQQGDAIWLWLNDAPVLLAAVGGVQRAGLADLEAANPDLAGLFPRELRHWTWMESLFVRLADGRLVRLDAATLLAHPHEVVDRERFEHAGRQTSTWHGGYATADFGVRHGRFGNDWVGLFSASEASDAANDPWGDHLFSSAEVADEGASARRRFWKATLGRTREFSEGSHPRLLSLEPIGPEREWLQGRLLKAPSAPGDPQWLQRGNTWRPAPGEPMRMSSPEGVLVLHRTRLDTRGRLALGRLGADLAPLWETQLPLAELSNRWPLPATLLLYGHVDDAPPGRSDRRELLVAVDLSDGSWRGWEVGGDRAAGGATDAPN